MIPENWQCVNSHAGNENVRSQAIVDTSVLSGKSLKVFSQGIFLFFQEVYSIRSRVEIESVIQVDYISLSLH
jgi:hypothetical protein